MGYNWHIYDEEILIDRRNRGNYRVILVIL